MLLVSKLNDFIPLNFLNMKALVTSIAFLLLFSISSFTIIEIPNTENGSRVAYTSTALNDGQVATFTMEFQEFKKGKPTKNGAVKVTYYLNGDQIAFKPELDGQESTVMIFDGPSKTMITLVDKDGEKTGMKMKMPKVMLDNDKKEDDKLDFKITPTNEAKTILGYDCKKYLMESTDFSGHAWVTEEVDLELEKALTFMDVQKKSNSNVPNFGDIKGFPLETITKSKKKDESYEMKVTDLKLGTVDESVFNTSGYNITDLSNFMNMGGE